MRNYVIFGLLLCLLDEAVCEIISVNASWSGALNLRCTHDQSLIFVKEALFGSLGEDGRTACTIPVGSRVRNSCNGKKSCKLDVIEGPDLNPKRINCTTKPGLYVKHVCINKGASILDLSQVRQKWSGYVKPVDKFEGGYKSNTVQWKMIEELCPKLPRSVQFELVDLDLAGDCSQEQLSVLVYEGGVEKKMGPFCQKDLDLVPFENRTRTFSNVKSVTFKFKTENRNTKSRGFLLKFLAMQCRPVPATPNTVVEYSLANNDELVYSHIRCGEAFLPWFGTPAKVVAVCHGNGCIFGCDECDFSWKKGTIGTKESRKIEDMKCVPPVALKTTTTTTTTTTTSAPTPTTTRSHKNSSEAPIPDHYSTTIETLPSHSNTTVSAAIPVFPPDPTRRADKRHIIAGIIGGVVGIVACLIVGILGLMVCRKSRCHFCCFNSSLYDKASYFGSQAPSHDTKTFGDSTLAMRYRPASTISTQVPHCSTLTSVQRSSAGSSILFPSNRRSKRKTLPHPSTLGYASYDESAPFFPDSLPASAFSPSVETYLEPDRRPSAPVLPPPPPQLLSFAPKPSSRAGVYQIYDENRSSRNALDRCEAPRHDRHSMAMISNHYYCHGEGSDNSGSENSVYEVVEEGMYSAGSTPCETRRNFPPAAGNDYVQPPRLPDRPATMPRSRQNLLPPAVPLAGEEEDEDGYQPVNCANRPTA